MKRKEKEIVDKNQISMIIKKCEVCRLAMSQDDVPYVVPLSFGYDGNALFFHTAASGKKVDILTANNRVCFEFEHGASVVPHESRPCSWSFTFQSVIGNGTVTELKSREDKVRGLCEIMAHYSENKWDFSTFPLNSVRVWRIDIDDMTGKQSPHS